MNKYYLNGNIWFKIEIISNSNISCLHFDITLSQLTVLWRYKSPDLWTVGGQSLQLHFFSASLAMLISVKVTHIIHIWSQPSDKSSQLNIVEAPGSSWNSMATFRQPSGALLKQVSAINLAREQKPGRDSLNSELWQCPAFCNAAAEVGAEGPTEQKSWDCSRDSEQMRTPRVSRAVK